MWGDLHYFRGVTVLSKDGTPGMGSGENVYAIPLDLTAELLWQPLQNWSAQDVGTARLLVAVLDYEEDDSPL